MKRRQETIMLRSKQPKISYIGAEDLPDKAIINEIRRRKISATVVKDLSDEVILNEIKRRKISTLKLEELAARPKPELEDLPNEVLLKVFSYMKPGDLIHCGQVSKRLRAICHDRSLWQKVNLYGKKVSAEFINFILDNGCNHLDLGRTN